MMEPPLDIKLVAMDLDGTLLGDDKEISAANQKALIACENRGILTVPASGRSRPSMSTLCRFYGLTSPMISMNGARVDLSPTGPSLVKSLFDRERAQKVYDILKASGLYFVLYGRDTVYRVNLTRNPDEKPRGMSLNAMRIENEMRFGSRLEVVEDEDAVRERGLAECYKMIIFSHDLPRLAQTRKILEAQTDMALSSSWNDNLEILMPGCGKGRAVRALAEHYGIRKDQIMVFGDYDNDLDMFPEAGWPVAMGNALPSLKEAARIVAPTNAEDGVAWVLNRYVLGDEGI